MITADRARELLDYDAERGVLVWAKDRGGHCKIGRVAGGGRLDSSGYFRIRLDGKNYLTHRIIWLWHHGEFPPEVVDHINGDPTDNRIENLRRASVGQNQYNSKRPKTNTSGQKGVYWNKRDKAWRVQICVNGKKKYIGVYADLQSAADAYSKAAVEHHGDFARLA